MPIKASYRDQRRNWHFDNLSVAATTNGHTTPVFIDIQSNAALLRLNLPNAEELANVILDFTEAQRLPIDGFERLSS